MLESFIQFFKEKGLSLTAHRYLLAVSGGLDSVVLSRLSKEAGLTFAVAHCNFGLRDEESDRDEAFVRSLGAELGVDVFAKKFATKIFAVDQKLSLQQAARNLRYDWFKEVRKEHGFACTLLAHHANDNIETLLINFFRGSGLDGLTGMPDEKAEAHCLRPMLHIKRSEIEQYATEKGLGWVEDSTNASNKYTRNFFRNELLPQIKNVFPQVEENLLGNIQRLKRTNSLYKTMVSDLKKKVCETKGEEIHIPVLKLMKYKDTSLIYEIIRDFGFGEGHVEELIKLAGAASGKYIANENFRIIRHRAWFIIAPKTVSAQTVVIEKRDEIIHFDNQALRIKNVRIDKFILSSSPNTAQLDAADVEFPLLLRKWKKGDYFYPLGMQKKKKLARFFIDQKLSQTAKENVWVIESHKRILWIVGYRIDNRFKVSEKTKNVLLLTQEH